MGFRLLIGVLVVLGLAGILRADDTEIYGTVTNPDIEPNILIIFDNSGSMDEADVPGIPYDPNESYACAGCTYSPNAVYYRRYNSSTGTYWWDLFTNNVNNLNCSTIRQPLLEQGYAEGYIRSTSPYNCGGSTKRYLRLGNYLNYIQTGIGPYLRRIDVAKQVVSDLIATTDNVRFGLMVFNYDQGGRLRIPIGSVNNAAHRSALLNAVNDLTPSTWTPLAETLAEAGLYYAGMPSWFNTSGFPAGSYSGGRYVSPMLERCQKHYVIIMTDGEPTKDRDSRLWSAPYINGDFIGTSTPANDPAKFDYAYDGSGYLEDVARYLYENDCNPAMGDGTAFDKQNITTFTIGFRIEQALLQRTAAAGGGSYYTAENYSALREAFFQILSSIIEKNACYVAPVVPISRMNRVFAGDKIYLGFFKPQQSGRWIGNIKRYKLESDGTLIDAKGDPATTPEGLIKDNALSWWTVLGNDGPAVEKGGAAEALSLQIESTEPRRVYTWTGTTPHLTDPTNAFVSGNTAITNSLLGVADSTARNLLFDTVRNGVFGDVIHSEPAIVHYDDKTVIYVGANDGMLHAIDDETGEELWSFIPPEHLGRLQRLTDADHDYFVDGSPTVYSGDGQKILVVGSRRGGESYVALDITDYTAPRFLYSLGVNVLGPSPENYERLGQSWSRPDRVTVSTGAEIVTTPSGVEITVTPADIFLFAAGYDTNQDQPTPDPEDVVGRGIFAVNRATGALLPALKVTPATHSSLGLTHSVVDVAGFDHDGDGITSRIYFGDLGGNLFGLKDDEMQTFTVEGRQISRSIVDGVWSAKKIFQAPTVGGRRLKILYAPDAVAEKYPPGVHGEYVFFGTGDRERPSETLVENRFYAVKNDWTMTSPLTEADLVDVTSNLVQLGTAEEKTQVKAQLKDKKGWFIRLENPGEKVVSSPRVYGGVVYFTTYTPSDDSGVNPEDPCAASTVRGVARLYALNYLDGGAVHNFSSTPESDRSGNTVALGKLDRSLAIGTAIPSAPVIAILAGGARLFIGVEGGIVSLPTVATQDMIRYYWNQIF